MFFHWVEFVLEHAVDTCLMPEWITFLLRCLCQRWKYLGSAIFTILIPALYCRRFWDGGALNQKN